MEPIFIWLLVASLLVVVELMTGTFYLLMLGIGALAALLLALAGASLEIQGTGAIIVGIAGCTLLRRRQRGQRAAVRVFGPDSDLNLDIGAMVAVADWTRILPADPVALQDVISGSAASPLPLFYRSRIRYRGAD